MFRSRQVTHMCLETYQLICGDLIYGSNCNTLTTLANDTEPAGPIWEYLLGPFTLQTFFGTARIKRVREP